MSEIIIIGKNSKLYQSIAKKLPNVLAISHKEVSQKKLAGASKIIVFSWSHKNQNDNLTLINSLPLDKTVFISTVAVLSLQGKRQWAAYPNWKFEIEQHVVRCGGMVARLGICDPNMVDKMSGPIPVTSPEDLIHIVLNTKFIPSKVVDAFTIRDGRASRSNKIISAVANYISDILPRGFIFQAPICYFLRSVGFLDYGYTRDAMSYFKEEIQCGYGVLGAAYAKRNPNPRRCTVVNPKPNRKIVSRGFVNTLIGYDLIGLSRSWHGVQIQENTDGTYRKDVPFFNRRPNPPSGTIYGEAKTLKILENYISIDLATKTGTKTFYSRKLILAMGPLENSLLLARHSNFTMRFSDHETGIVGSVEMAEALKLGYITRKLFLIRPGQVKRFETTDVSFLVDLRPIVKTRQVADENPNAFYLDSTRTLIAKLIRGFSLARINEAIFNKFGFGVPTMRAAVSVQILVEDCISFKNYTEIDRRRISSSEWDKIHSYVANTFKTYRPIKIPVTVDAQHIHGGAEVLEIADVAKAIFDQRIVVLGSPNRTKLGLFHHTEQIKQGIYNNSYNPLETGQLK